jgi:hypothetical protein
VLSRNRAGGRGIVWHEAGSAAEADCGVAAAPEPSETAVPRENADSEQTGSDAAVATWLLLVYRIPPEPTRLRAGVWRRLKGLGAVYLQNSAAALPASPANERVMRKLRHDILEMTGTAVLLNCEALAGESDILAAFQAARDDEYEEIVDRCRDFLAQVEKEHVAEHFSYAELEENDVDLAKLRSWYDKVRNRDTFVAPGRQAATDALDECTQSLEHYANQVYAREEEAH